MAERKKIKPDTEAVRPENASVGETLRAARLTRGMEYDDVSKSIHIRPTQLKAIEENNIEALPGMTYAVGFVRSYANFLGLNGAEIVHRFKAEQGHSPMQSKLSFPEPIAESRVPDPMMVGVGAFLAVVILVLWTVYSNMHSGSKVAEQIPSAPAATSVTEALPPAATPPSATATPPSVTAAVTPSATTAPVSETPQAGTAEQAVSPAAVTAEVNPVEDQQKAGPAPTDKMATDKAKEADTSSDEEDTVAAEDDASAEDTPAAKKQDQDSVINIKRGKSRITLKATQASWVQVTDAEHHVLYRKVLRPGEQYSVPDEPGLSLDTANAGGLEIIIDGRQVQSVGKAGEIVRGIVLDPKELKIQKLQVRD